MAATTVLEKHVLPELHDQVLLCTSPTGYSNCNLALEWLKHFDQLTRAKTEGYRLLLFDGFDPHLEIKFIQYCWDHQIIPFSLRPHTTHLCQPLDLVVFQPYKHWHGEAIDSAIRRGAEEFDKLDFLSNLAEIREKTFKKTTIQSAWRKAGIIPWNPQIVIDRAQKQWDKFQKTLIPNLSKDDLRQTQGYNEISQEQAVRDTRARMARDPEIRARYPSITTPTPTSPPPSLETLIIPTPQKLRA